MPNYKGHLIGGAVTYGLVVGALIVCLNQRVFHFEDLIIWLMMCLLGCLFPDIDIRSKGQKIFYRFLLIITIMVLLSKRFDVLALVTFAAIFPSFVSHRGMMHNIWFIVTIPFLAVVALSYYTTGIIPHAAMCYLFFVAGALSHVILDFGPIRLVKRIATQTKHRKKW